MSGKGFRVPGDRQCIFELSVGLFLNLFAYQEKLVWRIFARNKRVYSELYHSFFQENRQVKVDGFYSPFSVVLGFPNASVRASPTFSARVVMSVYSSNKSPTCSRVRSLSS